MQIKAYMLSCPQREAMRSRSLANLEATDWGEAAIVEVDQTTHERLQQRQTEISQTDRFDGGKIKPQGLGIKK